MIVTLILLQASELKAYFCERLLWIEVPILSQIYLQKHSKARECLALQSDSEVLDVALLLSSESQRFATSWGYLLKGLSDSEVLDVALLLSSESQRFATSWGYLLKGLSDSEVLDVALLLSSESQRFATSWGYLLKGLSDSEVLDVAVLLSSESQRFATSWGYLLKGLSDSEVLDVAVLLSSESQRFATSWANLLKGLSDSEAMEVAVSCDPNGAHVYSRFHHGLRSLTLASPVANNFCPCRSNRKALFSKSIVHNADMLALSNLMCSFH